MSVTALGRKKAEPSQRSFILRGTTLRHTLVGSVARLEVQVGRPVVAEIFRESTRGAGSLGPDVAGHGHVERVAAYDLVDVGRGDQARVHEGIDPVNDDLCTPEPQHGHAAAASELRHRRRERREAEDGRRMHSDERETKVLYSAVLLLGYRGGRGGGREAHLLHTAIDLACLYKDGRGLARLPVADRGPPLLCCDGLPDHTRLSAMLYHLEGLVIIAEPRRHLSDRL